MESQRFRPSSPNSLASRGKAWLSSGALVAATATSLLACVSQTAPSPGIDKPQLASEPPPSVPMDAQLSLGLWKSNFGPVKLVQDPNGPAGELHGVWVYDRDGQEVIGYFSGQLEGNVLQLSWTEPSTPSDLTGEGYLVFDTAGRSFQGQWWTYARDNGGEWTGLRLPVGTAAPDSDPPTEPPPSIDDGTPGPATGPAEPAPTGQTI